MKTIKIVLVLFISILAVNMKAQRVNDEDPIPDGPQITFKKDVHDFGTIKEGDIVETKFEFTNTGNAPLLITKIKASCGCTIPSDWKKEEIMPGETSSFTVKFNSKNKPNKQNKRIKITSNTAKNNEYATIKANVIPNPDMQKKRDERMKRWKEKRDAKMKAAKAKKILPATKKQLSDKMSASKVKK